MGHTLNNYFAECDYIIPYQCSFTIYLIGLSGILHCRWYCYVNPINPLFISHGNRSVLCSEDRPKSGCAIGRYVAKLLSYICRPQHNMARVIQIKDVAMCLSPDKWDFPKIFYWFIKHQSYRMVQRFVTQRNDKPGDTRQNFSLNIETEIWSRCIFYEN